MSHLARILALDPGDAWIGTALSDALGYTCKPHKTIPAHEITLFLTTFFKENADVVFVVVGCPKPIRGGDSEQTEKVRIFTAELAERFPNITFTLWDERYSSARASSLSIETGRKRVGHGSQQAREAKLRLHSVAAAFILQSYLDYRSNTLDQTSDE